VLDDSVPLPIPAVVEASDAGDRVVEPASGDPYFLGFAAARHYPPAGERIDPLLEAALARTFDDGRPENVSWGFVMFSRRITPARLDALRLAGARVIEFHPHYTLKVALGADALARIASLDFVRWVGVPRAVQKVHPLLAEQVAKAAPGDVLDVYVSVHDSDKNEKSEQIVLAQAVSVDPDGTQAEVAGFPATKWMSHGWQEARLVALGLDVHEYVDGIRAFRARMTKAQLEDLVAQDFVQFVEADLPIAPMAAPHEESTPMITTDRTRASWSGATSTSVIAGFADSGLETDHQDLGIWGWGWDLASASGPWNDENGHGTHVAGTIMGRGNANSSKRGNAPGLASWSAASRFYNVRIFNAAGSGSVSTSSVMNLYNTAITDGNGVVTPTPDLVSHSWGSTSYGGFIGSEADCRTIDNQVHNQAQLHVWAAGNGGNNTSGSLSQQPSAKNAFTVGNAIDYADAIGDPGTLWTGSSTGPAGDGRWKPNVNAPGRWISSANSANTTGYTDKSGTSMATPHVAGLAAQVMDHHTWLQGWPEAAAAVLMASATTKDNVTLSSPTATHLDNYGAGRVQAWRAHEPSSNTGWYAWTLDLTNSSTNADFTVSAGATRLVVATFYSESAASAGASQALVNNYDLWIDSPPVDTANNNTGEYFAQQSSIDNAEIRIINNPPAGQWRWKIFNQSTTGRMYGGVAVQVLYGDTTPDGTFDVAAIDPYVQPNQNVTITATATNPASGSVASAVFLDSTSSGDTLQSSSTTLDDGPVTALHNAWHGGRDVLLGDMISGDSKTATWVTRWATEGVKSFSVNARSDNWVNKSDSVNIYVDGTPPPLVTGLTSPTHPVNTWRSTGSVTFNWTQPGDNVSGMDGYGESWSTVPGVFVANTKDFEEGTSFVRVFSTGTYYWALKGVDNSGNWTASTVEYGPIKIDLVVPANVGALSSPTHTVGVQSCSTSVTINWTPSTDADSGLAGYAGVWDTSPSTDPTSSLNYGSGSVSATVSLSSSNTARWFHLRARDNAGNWGATRHYGPVYANANSVVTYCTAKTNSLGCVPTIGTNGVQPDKSNGNFRVTCSNVLNQKAGLLFWGYAPSATPFQGGFKCVANPTVRTPSISSGGNTSGNSCTGSYSFTFSTAYMNSLGIDPGDTLYAQWWTRDPAAPFTTGLSNAVQFTVCQ
jgi:subtilisin family serine protease